MSQQLESAIPEEFQVQRLCPMSMKKGWKPPYPSFSARFDQSWHDIGVVIFGIQGPNDRPHRTQIHDVGQKLMTETAKSEEVLFRDQAEFMDSANMINRIIVCYFAGNQKSRQIASNLGDNWLKNSTSQTVLGFYVEHIWPTMDRIETLYSSDHVQGVANLAVRLSGEIREHGYWGSARDRLPAAQIDPLAPGRGLRNVRENIVEVRDIHNLCLIRSGQDWSETTGEERFMYEEEVEPVLSAGMDFLTHSGAEAGCISNRYVRVLDEQGHQLDQSYGMSWWHSMESLDDWARAHPTHKAIFGVAMRYLGEHGGSGHLKLTHEVFVVEKAQGHFRYINCHPGTGVLPAV